MDAAGAGEADRVGKTPVTRIRICLLALLSALGWGQDLSRLPDWARGPATEAAAEAPPPDCDAWVLLDRTEIAYLGGGEIRSSKFRLVKVLTDGGLGEARLWLAGMGGRATKINRIRGWNLRPDGDLIKLSRDKVITLDASDAGELSTDVVSIATLDRPVRGSLLAFESVETTRHPLGPVDQVRVLQKNPVRRWEVLLGNERSWSGTVSKGAPRLSLRHGEPWLKQPVVTPEGIRIANLPPLPADEGGQPDPRNVFPWVAISFADPSLTQVPGLERWDDLAKWFGQMYAGAVKIPPDSGGQEGRSGGLRGRLERLSSWMSRNLAYRQVYLAPDRGWVPEKGDETLRKRFGDCKDLAACFIGGARAEGIDAFPVLCRINDGLIEADEPVNPFAFNHVIVAVRLGESLGLSAEVSASSERYLLVDPTSRTTLLGHLPSTHRGRRVLICAPQAGIWVEVPDKSLEKSDVAIKIEGSLDARNSLQGTIRVEESGDYLGLRGAAVSGGNRALLDRLRTWLSLSPSDELDLVSAGDPLQLSGTFDLKTRLVVRSPVLSFGAGRMILPLGFPNIPEPLQRFGTGRRSPILVAREPGPRVLELDLRSDAFSQDSERPIALDTPFRGVSGVVRTGGGVLSIRFTQEGRTAAFGLDALEAGLKEARKDRNAYRSLLGEILRLPGNP